MRPSQIIAIARVRLEGPVAARERLIWFYRDLVGLVFIEDMLNPSVLRFQSAQLDLHIELSDRPKIDPSCRRALLSVRSLEATATVLDEEGVAYQPLSGWTWSDRRLALLDPGGNRVELKQEWRRGVFPAPGERALAEADPAADTVADKNSEK